MIRGVCANSKSASKTVKEDFTCANSLVCGLKSVAFSKAQRPRSTDDVTCSFPELLHQQGQRGHANAVGWR